MSDRADLGNLPSLVLLRQELIDAAEREPIRRRSRFRTWLAGLCAVGAIAVSPLGAAIADELADLVGIGDPPSDTRPRDAIVIGAPATAVPFEIVAIGAEPTRVVPPGEEPIPCVAPEFPSVQVVGGQSCMDAELQRVLPRTVINPAAYGAPAELAANGAIIVQGFADPEVARVELVVPTPSGDHTGPAEMATLSRSLSSQIGLDDRVRFFVGFVTPADISATGAHGRFTKQDAHRALKGLTIRALAADGAVLTARSLDTDKNASVLSQIPPGS